MNDQSQMMSGHQPPPQPPPQLMNQPPVPMMMQSQPMSMGMIRPIPPPPMMLGHSQGMMMMNNTSNNNNNNNNSVVTNPNQRGYKPWQQNPMKFNKKQQLRSGGSSGNWKGKMGKANNIPNVSFSNINNNSNNMLGGGSGSSGGGGYNPPSLNELQNQNRMKARKYYHPKKRFNNPNNANANARFAPYAPRNTTSFIIRAKKAGGIAEMVSPCPVTPAVLPTPIFSPSRELLGDMAKEEWGVDGYGSMKGLIRLRSPTGNDEGVHDDEEDDEGNGSSESDVEEHVEVERRLDHDLSRFEMIYPTTYGSGYGGEYSYNNVLENRVDDQDTHIAQLEEENLTLKERLFLMERELGDLRRRLQFLERRQGGRHGDEFAVDAGEEVVENVYENDDNENESDGGSDVGPTMGVENKSDEVMDYDNEVKRESNEVSMGENVHTDEGVLKTENNVGNQEVNMNRDEDAVMVKENEVKREEVGNEVGLDNLSLKHEDGKGIEAEDRAVDEEKHESENIEVCSQKSIGSGD